MGSPGPGLLAERNKTNNSSFSIGLVIGWISPRQDFPIFGYILIFFWTTNKLSIPQSHALELVEAYEMSELTL